MRTLMVVKMINIVNEFNTYKNSIGNRVDLYRSVAKTFHIYSALYPGSHIDIMPSFVIPDVTYIDNFKGTVKFFNEMETIHRFIDENKEYDGECKLNFIESDYKKSFEIEPVDLIISQFAGFVGQETKRYLKEGGILLCNDSHGDATLAFSDEDYTFVGVIVSNNKIETKNLDSYFKFARKRPIDIGKVKGTMKGPNYKVKAENYLFRKIKK